MSLEASGNSDAARCFVAYVIEPFLLAPGEAISNRHTHDWTTWRIVQAFLARGFDVDVVSYLNRSFRPARAYDYFFAARSNFERLAASLPSTCRKVVHLDTAHWLTNNTAAYQRLLDLRARRGVVLSNIKMVETNWALEQAPIWRTILGERVHDRQLPLRREADRTVFQFPHRLSIRQADDKEFESGAASLSLVRQ
ncbi:MAG: hypothetical protein H6994_03295 [Pseudomonadales bacterium]|nr:hypothetical protein [Pseudomonadales bacterium]